VQELSRGNDTADPAHHSGEGIFFTSKVADHFQVDPHADRVVDDVFREFTEDHAFVRTRPVAKLFEIGTTFVARSEARRLLDGLAADFETVEVDFAGVTDVGQGFVDELLRVWPATHPGKVVIPINMNPAVDFMVRRHGRQV
jgi:STAS-like domain of unknown function (DUF4325)